MVDQDTSLKPALTAASQNNSALEAAMRGVVAETQEELEKEESLR